MVVEARGGHARGRRGVQALFRIGLRLARESDPLRPTPGVRAGDGAGRQRLAEQPDQFPPPATRQRHLAAILPLRMARYKRALSSILPMLGNVSQDTSAVPRVRRNGTLRAAAGRVAAVQPRWHRVTKRHVENVSGELSLRYCQVRSRPRSQRPDLSLQLLDLLEKPLLACHSEARCFSSPFRRRCADQIPVQHHAERTLLLQKLRGAAFRYRQYSRRTANLWRQPGMPGGRHARRTGGSPNRVHRRQTRPTHSTCNHELPVRTDKPHDR